MLDKSPTLARLNLAGDQVAFAEGKKKSPVSSGWLKCEGQLTNLLIEGELAYDGIDELDLTQFEQKGKRYRLKVIPHPEDLTAIEQLYAKVGTVPPAEEEWTTTRSSLYRNTLSLKCPVEADKFKFEHQGLELDPANPDRNREVLVAGNDVKAVVDAMAWFNLKDHTYGLTFTLKSLKACKPSSKKANGRKAARKALAEEQDSMVEDIPL